MYVQVAMPINQKLAFKQLVLVNQETNGKSETKGDRSHTHKITSSAQVHHSLFSPVLWFSPSIGSVSKVRLMLFSVCFLLWQLPLK